MTFHCNDIEGCDNSEEDNQVVSNSISSGELRDYNGFGRFFYIELWNLIECFIFIGITEK